MSLDFRYGHFQTPLRFQFRHASANRKQTDNVIVCLTDNAGHSGYGEGCPREYVTGETSKTAAEFLKTYGTAFTRQVSNLPELELWTANYKDLIDQNPAAFCALELAAIDLFARKQNLTVEKYLGLAPLRDNVQYTAVIGDSSPLKTRLISLAYRCYRFREFKVKLSGNLTRDQTRLATLPATANIRVDANNLWSEPDSAVDYLNSLEVGITAIEEPLTPFDYKALASVSGALNIPVILDESLYTENHLAQATEHLTDAIANIRVSKCGGIQRSIRLANQCIKAGYGVILGAQVGETSLLTRAALTVGNGLTKKPISSEGAYGKILLKHDICQRDLRFGATGVLKTQEHPLLSGPGLGLDIVKESICWPDHQ